MRQAQYTNGQFINGNNLNYATADSIASARQAASIWSLPGLINPSAISFAAGTGLNATVTFGSGALVQFASGIISQGLGTTNGSTSSEYTIDLSSFVPASGSQVVSLVAQYFSLSQTEFTVNGPPPGNPAYNPGFAPFTAYLESVDSLSVVATTGTVDNVSSILLATCTLSAGQSTAPTTYTVSGQVMASRIATVQFSSVTPPITLDASDAGIVQNITASGTISLPVANSVPGLPFLFSTAALASSYATLAANGSDEIVGAYGFDSTSSTVNIQPNAQLAIVSDGTNWQVTHNVGAIPFSWSGAPSGITYSAASGMIVPYTVSASDAVAGTSNVIPISQATTLFAPVSGNSSQTFAVASGSGSSAVPYSQAVDYLELGDGATLTPTALVTVGFASLSASGSMTLESGSVLGQKVTILGNAGNAFKVSSSVSSGSPAFFLPDGSNIFSWTIPANPGAGITLEWDNANWRAQTFGNTVVANATANNEAVALGQLSAPMGAISQVEGNNSTVTATASFTAPGAGLLIAMGSRNDSSHNATAGDTGTLYINGTEQMTDNTTSSMTHFGFATTSGGAVNAQYTTGLDIDFSCNVALYWIPTV